MRSIRVVAGVAGHLLLVISAGVAVLVATSHTAYPPPLRVALIVLVAVLAAVTLYGRFPLGLGPVAGSVPRAPRTWPCSWTGSPSSPRRQRGTREA